MQIRQLLKKLDLVAWKKGQKFNIEGIKIMGDEIYIVKEKQEPPKANIKETKKPKAKAFIKDAEVKKPKSSTKRSTSK